MKKILIFSGAIFCLFQIFSSLSQPRLAHEGTRGDAYAQAIIISGTLQEDIKRKPFEYNLYRESLIVRDGRVYIYSSAVGRTRQYYVLHYLLPETVTYNSETREIVYQNGNNESIVIGRSKKFLRLIPYIALSEDVKLLSSPYGAKLILTPEQQENSHSPSISIAKESCGAATRNHKDMDSMLTEKCSQCHVIDYILTHKEWTEDDCLHVFSRLQAKEPFKLSEKEQRLIDKFKVYQRVALNSKEVRKFNKLREIGRRDVRSIAESVYENNCAHCHSPNKMETITRRYPKRRCATIAQRMQEKDPALYLEANADALAEYLWQLKIRPVPKQGKSLTQGNRE